MGNFISGKELLTHLDILPFELLQMVKEGLQPYNKFGEPIISPDITRKKTELDNLKNQSVVLKKMADRWRAIAPVVTRIDEEEIELMSAKNKLERTTQDIKVLENDLAQIENIYSWANYELPEDEKSKEWVLNLLLNAYYKKDNTEQNEEKSVVLDRSINENHVLNAANYLKRTGNFWTIRFNGKEFGPIKHVDGLLYIAYLLERPGTSISCKNLHQSVSGITPGGIMDKSMAIEAGMNMGSSRQAVNDGKAKHDYFKKYRELQNSLELAESDLEKNEIEKEMADLLGAINAKTFTKDDKKAQANLKKRMETAYKVLNTTGMKEISEYLRGNIKPNDAYDLRYTGEIAWEIIIN